MSCPSTCERIATVATDLTDPIARTWIGTVFLSGGSHDDWGGQVGPVFQEVGSVQPDSVDITTRHKQRAKYRIETTLKLRTLRG